MFVITTLIIMPLKKEEFVAFRYFLSVDKCKTRWRNIRDSYKKNNQANDRICCTSKIKIKQR